MMSLFGGGIDIASHFLVNPNRTRLCHNAVTILVTECAVHVYTNFPAPLNRWVIACYGSLRTKRALRCTISITLGFVGATGLACPWFHRVVDEMTSLVSLKNIATDLIQNFMGDNNVNKGACYQTLLSSIRSPARAANV